MENPIPILQKTQLFRGIAAEEITAMLGCLNARSRSFQKGGVIFRQGMPVDDIAVLLSGKLHIQKDDYWGNCNIINAIHPGEMFGEAYIAPDSGMCLNNVVAIEDSDIILFDAKKIITTCSSACCFHAMIIQNLMFAISGKNRKLVQKLDHMSKRSTREKLMSYLSEESSRQGSENFTIPFNRQQLADFLSVDRSAMSNELCKMRDEGLLTFNRSHFTLIG